MDDRLKNLKTAMDRTAFSGTKFTEQRQATCSASVKRR